jgi:hypothetical protein
VTDDEPTGDPSDPNVPDLVAGARIRLLCEGTFEEATAAAEAAERPTIVHRGADGVWRAWQMLPGGRPRRG